MITYKSAGVDKEEGYKISIVDTNNKIYIAGQYGYVASSTDMHTWTAHHLNTNSTILQIVQLKKIDPQ